MTIEWQIFFAVLATIATIASAIAAWSSQSAAKETLNFQKKLSKHQDSLQLLRSTIERLWQLRRIVTELDQATDEEFTALLSIIKQIKADLESLVIKKVVPPSPMTILKATTTAEIGGCMPVAVTQIDGEIQRLQAKIDEIFS